jgi:hypothetical protein
LFWQITSTTPWRRMILHFSHIGLTDGRTFMFPFSGLSSGGPALAAASGRRYRDVDLRARPDALHLALAQDPAC